MRIVLSLFGTGVLLVVGSLALLGFIGCLYNIRIELKLDALIV